MTEELTLSDLQDYLDRFLSEEAPSLLRQVRPEKYAKMKRIIDLCHMMAHELEYGQKAKGEI